MAQQTINIGSAPNSGDGDPIRTAFTKANANFSELYSGQAALSAALTSEIQTRAQADGILQSAISELATMAGITGALGFTPQNVAERGLANGYAPLNADGKLDAGFLPGATASNETDFNAFVTTGLYVLTGDGNAPLPGPTNRWALQVIADPQVANRVLQRAYLIEGGAKLEIASRRRIASGAWQAWQSGAAQAVDIGFDDSAVYQGSPNVQAALVASANYTGFVETQAMLQNFVYGLILGNWSGTADRVNFGVTISPGQCRGNGVTAARTVTWAKMLNAAWAKGFGAGGLDTGSVQPNATYHAHGIRENATGDLDVLLSASAASPVVPTGWTRVQRLGPVLTDGSGNIRPFVQSGNQFWHNVEGGVVNYSQAGVRAKSAIAVTVPTGVRVEAILSLYIHASGTDVQATGNLYDGINTNIRVRARIYGSASVNGIEQELRQFTDTSAQILFSLGSTHASTASSLNTLGWIDYSIPRIG